MKRISGTPCAMVIVALSLGLTGVAHAAESGKKEHDQVQANLKRFDQLDFEAYSERKNMKLFREIHCPDVKVVFPDGRTTEGIEPHVADINNLFNGTPDNRSTAQARRLRCRWRPLPDGRRDALPRSICSGITRST